VIEAGKWYEWQGSWPESQKGRPIFVVGLAPESLVFGRWANGCDYLCFTWHLEGPLSAIKAGEAEPCTLCAGRLWVPHYESRDKEPWFLQEIGLKPCPNCHELPLENSRLHLLLPAAGKEQRQGGGGTDTAAS